MSLSAPHPSSPRPSADSSRRTFRAFDPDSPVLAGATLPPSPQVRLVKNRAQFSQRSWPVALPERGRWTVTGPAGSGVSSFLIDTVLARLRAGADPNGMLVIAASKESGARLRAELAHNLGDYIAGSSMVRSVHSLAFALLRSDDRSATGTGEEPGELRLITGAEQDAVIRELLAGQVEDNSGAWPQEIRPALGFVGFARQLRDFLLRAIERGLSPDELIENGTRYGEDMWVAAGHFLREYEQTLSLAGVHSYSAAELVSQVLLREHLTQTHPWHTVIVDDAQLLDPTSGKLIESLSRSAQLTVIGGDVNQAVFAFRGASSDFLSTFPATESVRLAHSQRRPEPACISIVDSPATQRDVLADTVRRRHLEDGVPWSQIAVIVRGQGDIGTARRTLLAAGVPVHINPTDVVLAQQRLVAALLLGLRALNSELTNSELEDLATGPVGGADPVALRRLIRGLRRWAPDQRGIDTLRSMLTGALPDFGDVLTGRERDILERVRSVLSAGRQAQENRGSVEEILWAVWSATGLSDRLAAAALRGGATGSQADRDLDAVMALFDAAGDFAERRPQASIDAFVDHITEQELPTGVRDRRVAVPEAVPIVTAHGAVGQEFDTVVLLGAQEGSWPSLGLTGTIFHQDQLIDLIDRGITPGTPVSHLATRLAEERRLFHVATTRHTSRLHIVAIEQSDGDEIFEPSRFIEEFAHRRVNFAADARRARRREAVRRQREEFEKTGTVTSLKDYLASEKRQDAAQTSEQTRPAHTAAAGDISAQGPGTHLDPLAFGVLSIPSFIARLRLVVGDDAASEHARAQAARQLARLAAAGVPGAHPDQWLAARDLANDSELDTSGRLSPSRIEDLMECPLYAVMKKVAETAEDSPIHMLRGTMAHAFFEALGRGVDPEMAQAMTMEAFFQIQTSPAWQREMERKKFAELLANTRAWIDSTRDAFELVGVEVPAKVTVDDGVIIAGYIDRLERSRGEGQGLHIIDLKSGKQMPSKDDTQEHPQLSAYQLMLAHGEVTAGGEGKVLIRTASAGAKPPERSGATLLYPAVSTKRKTADQARLDDEQLREFSASLPPLVAQLRGPRLTARECSKCDTCPLRPICPVHNEGKQLTDV